MDFSKINANEKSLNALLGAFGKTRFAKSDFGDETEWKPRKTKLEMDQQSSVFFSHW